MRVHVRPHDQPQQDLSLDQVNAMLQRGELDGDELAWTPGLQGWTTLARIDGVLLPVPPAFLSDDPAAAPLPESRTTPGTERVVQAHIHPPATAAVGAPRGVGGWLMFFCIGLVILSPLSTLGRMGQAWETVRPVMESFPSLRTAVVLENVAYVAILCAGVLAGSRIWAGSPNGRTIARNYLLGRAVLGIGATIIAALIVQDLPTEVSDAVTAAAVQSTLTEVLLCGTWWLYFKYSRRVRNTYGAER